MSSAGWNSADWYRQSFGDLYPLVYSHRNPEAAQREIASLARWAPLEPGDRVLDACCGSGRHLAALISAGCDAVGFDLSDELISRTRRDPTLRGKVFRADIRRIPLALLFDRVVNLFTSFGYFQDEDDNRRGFNALARHVDRGGVLILDHMNAGRIRRTLVPESVSHREEYRIVQQRRIDGRRVRKRIELTRITDGRQWNFYEDVRMYDPVEMIEMARNAGFTGVTLHGSFDGEPYEADSERMILRAARS